MSDQIKHECGIGLLRLFKPLDFYQKKYGTALWGYNKMYLMMEKQRNRGQDGAGLATIKLDLPPGKPYLFRTRNNKTSPWTELYKNLGTQLELLREAHPARCEDPHFLKQKLPFIGEIMLGHLRYGTHGNNGVDACHPVKRTSNYRNKNLVMAGNFNLTNVDQLFQRLVELGQHPRKLADTEIVLERVGHFLDKQNEKLYKKYHKNGFQDNEAAQLISDDLKLPSIFKNAARAWDGGYVMGGMIGNGDSFIIRDPHAIRPCYYYHNDEFMVAASERSVLVTVFDLHPDEVQELGGGEILYAKACEKRARLARFAEEQERKSCSFERIYFSRGGDIKIYNERKALGRLIIPRVLEAVDHDIEHTVFSFIPNTAETSFLGMMKGLEDELNKLKIKQIMALGSDPQEEDVQRILSVRMRMEKSADKDVKMRTFIADDSSRDEMVSHVYDVTRGIIENEIDNLVCIDDSIVRGTTLKKSILHMLARLRPKKVVIVSSAPQIRYPDCYGIDMANIGKLIAFQAAIALLKDRGMEAVIEKVYQDIQGMKNNGGIKQQNVVREIYAPFTAEEISAKIADLLCPEDFKPELEIIYQSLETLHEAIPNHKGDWYFSGNYPTPGGNQVVNQAFVNYYEGKTKRAYEVMV